MKQESLNKSIIRDFYRRAVAQGDIAFADELISEDYIQHSLVVKPGKAGLLEALAMMKQMPKPASSSPPFMRLLAEGDYVITNMSFDWGGRQKAVLDLYRLEGGKIVEHWDAMQDQSDTSLNGNALMDGPMPLDDDTLTADNKAIVKAFYQQVLVKRDFSVLPDFVAHNLIQHRSDIANGLDGLSMYWQQQSESLTIGNVARIIGEADFVVIQYESRQGKKITTFYDIFRLSNGKIVEQWGLHQVATL
ncbi:ester cyclase [Spirosoma sp. BT702]|uniref:Ester cyclase n=1 Tax=Spirosoma profusum TaxID=2771354 RepID=A0A927ARL6_9BACT|nr:ester cyclase [Spirosoma profusum]MBD2702446.1 ester cyclase [Spirosoma profusum]